MQCVRFYTMHFYGKIYVRSIEASYKLRVTLDLMTKGSCFKASGLYSVGEHFEPQSEHRPFKWGISWFSSIPAGKLRDISATASFNIIYSPLCTDSRVTYTTSNASIWAEISWMCPCSEQSVSTSSNRYPLNICRDQTQRQTRSFRIGVAVMLGPGVFNLLHHPSPGTSRFDPESIRKPTRKL